MKFFHASILLTIFGEAIILACFLLFGGCSSISWLNFVVTSVIYFLWFGQAFIPWFNLKDKSSRAAGSLGITWFGIFFYSLFAILAMLACNVRTEKISFTANLAEIPFAIQLIIHLILLFILFFILLLGKGAGQKVAKVYEKERKLTENKESLKIIMSLLRQKLSVKNDFPAWILERVNKLEEEVRYLSPNNTTQAQVLEKAFVEVLKKFENELDFNKSEQIKIDELLKQCEIILTERKRVLN
jgi:hypothetical protein